MGRNITPRSQPRIFVIGDSFTQATDVSDDKTYYAVLDRVLDVEAFGYGVGGYGSLQEFLQFEKYFDLVKPNLIVWQYSTNDLINNSSALESESSINSNGMVRPYLKNDQIEYVLPKKLGKDMRLFSMRYCRLCYLVLSRIDKLNAAKALDSVEMKTFVGGPAHAIFLESSKVTDDIMRMVRMRAGTVPIVAFIVGTGPPYGSEYENSLMEISRRHDIVILNDVERAVLEKEREKREVRAGDGAHWNELGHHLVGQALASEIQRAFPSKLREHHK